MKLHLGCGARYLKGFTHIDIAEFPHIDFKISVNDLSMFESNTIDEIYTSHTFEYFDRFDAQKVLKEWHRVLRPGKSIYITVPNFDSLIEIYSQTRDLSKITGPLFGRWQNSNEHSPIFHKTTWNYQELSNELSKAGFANISRFDPVNYLNEIDPEFDDYSLAYFPHMDQTGTQVSLAVRAIKSGG